MPKNGHTLRQSGSPPDAATLVNGNGQFQMVMAFRQGRCTDAYIRFRQWCWMEGVNPSDVFNSIIEPLVHFLENFARRDTAGNIVVSMNLGEVILDTHYGNRPVFYDKAKYKATRARKIQLI